MSFDAIGCQFISDEHVTPVCMVLIPESMVYNFIVLVTTSETMSSTSQSAHRILQDDEICS